MISQLTMYHNVSQWIGTTEFENECALLLFIQKFYRKNKHIFKHEQYYGLDIQTELCIFVRQCIDEFKDKQFIPR